MERVLVKNADLLATFDDTRREIADGAMLIEGKMVRKIGTTAGIMQRIYQQ